MWLGIFRHINSKLGTKLGFDKINLFGSSVQVKQNKEIIKYRNY